MDIEQFWETTRNKSNNIFCRANNSKYKTYDAIKIVEFILSIIEAMRESAITMHVTSREYNDIINSISNSMSALRNLYKILLEYRNRRIEECKMLLYRELSKTHDKVDIKTKGTHINVTLERNNSPSKNAQTNIERKIRSIEQYYGVSIAIKER